MNKNYLAAAGTFVISALVLFSVGLFLIGNRHKAFTHRVDFYTDMTNVKDSIVDEPMVIEGYSSQAFAADQVVASRTRALLVARYLGKRFHLKARNIGIMPLNATPPALQKSARGTVPASFFLPG